MSTTLGLEVAGNGRRAGKSPKPNFIERLAKTLSVEGEKQTRIRIQREKTAPDGTPWAANVPWYAATKKGAKAGKVLESSGALRDSLSAEPSTTEAEWGTNLIYAGVHQDGAVITPKNGEYLSVGGHLTRRVVIPARPFLGLSDDNFADFEEIVIEAIDQYVEQLL